MEEDKEGGKRVAAKGRRKRADGAKAREGSGSEGGCRARAR